MVSICESSGTEYLHFPTHWQGPAGENACLALVGFENHRKSFQAEPPRLCGFGRGAVVVSRAVHGRFRCPAAADHAHVLQHERVRVDVEQDVDLPPSAKVAVECPCWSWGSRRAPLEEYYHLIIILPLVWSVDEIKPPNSSGLYVVSKSVLLTLYGV